MEIVLAETVSFTDQEILVILLVLLGFLALVVITLVLGCFWAWRAGRGSQMALIGWLIMGPLVLVPTMLMSIPGVFNGNFFLMFPLAALATQVALYFAARQSSDAPG